LKSQQVSPLPLKRPIVKPIAVLPVSEMPGFAIVDVIGKTDVAAAVEFLPKMA